MTYIEHLLDTGFIAVLAGYPFAFLAGWYLHRWFHRASVAACERLTTACREGGQLHRAYRRMGEATRRAGDTAADADFRGNWRTPAQPSLTGSEKL